MQYTTIKLVNRPVIIDLKEADYLNTFIRTKEMPQLQLYNNETAQQTVVYGAVLHNEGCDTIEHRKWLECAFAYPQTTGYGLLSILDIQLAPTMVSGGLRFTPFAALVESDCPLNLSNEQGVSAFVRFEDMDIVTNLINRECIYAMRQAVEASSVTKQTWRRAVNEDTMLQVAFSIA